MRKLLSKCQESNTRNKKAFTLLEILIVLAIIAILSTLSIKIYHNFIKSSFESEVVNALMNAASAQEQYYADYGTYASYIEDLLGFNDGTRDNKFILNNNKDDRRKIMITIEHANATEFKMVAENLTESQEWQIKWEIQCSIGSSINGCKPKQIKGSNLLNP